MYDKWRSQQRKLRQKHLLCKSTHLSCYSTMCQWRGRCHNAVTGNGGFSYVSNEPGKCPRCRQSAATLRTRAGPPTASPPRRLDSATYSHSGKRPRPDAAHQGSELAGTHHSGEQEVRCRKRQAESPCDYFLQTALGVQEVSRCMDCRGVWIEL
ncbi:hypothetical protein XENOCAPTIV_024911 [Xenoophorus captivus]|uniref:Transcription factor zinc-finger domain-containing protein n=1 Tax=Xenoophorus captivus TaxID=1517983 RepID=A0ABV0RDT4_9TELE